MDLNTQFMRTSKSDRPWHATLPRERKMKAEFFKRDRHPLGENELFECKCQFFCDLREVERVRGQE